MGAIQNSLNAMLGSVAAASYAISKSFEKDNPKATQEAPSIDLQMREKALKTAQKKIDAINAQQLGRNTRMKQIREVINDFSQSDFTIKGGKK